YEPQATYTNNFATDTIKTSGTGTTPGDDLRLAITHTPSSPITPGQSVTFHLTATNNGTGDYSDYAELRATFPPGIADLKAVSVPTGYTCTTDTQPNAPDIQRIKCANDAATIAVG